MKILAFLQNMWVNEPEKVKELVKTTDWNRLVYWFLFRGCKTGQVIKQVFGELANKIIYDETTREIAGDPKTTFKPDLKHMHLSILKHKPDIIITFGKIAENAMMEYLCNKEYFTERTADNYSISVIHRLPHPAAASRNPQYMLHLKHAAKQIKEYKINS
jgi:hypothetical protein